MCYQQTAPAVSGIAYNATGAVVASASFGSYTMGVRADEPVRTGALPLASASNDIVRVEFTTPQPTASTFAYAVIGAASPTLEVVCEPSAVLRGTDVTCTATLTPKQPFTIVERHSQGDGYRADVLEPVDSPNGEPYAWSGKAVIPTTVTMVAILKTPNADRVTSAPASFDIQVRTGAEWTGLKLPPPPAPLFLEGGLLPTDPFSNVRAGEQINSPDGALGQTVLELTTPWGYVNDGPNGMMYYARFPMTVNPDSLRIIVHAWLQRGSAFYRRQQGSDNPVMGLRDCRRSDIDLLRQRVIEHELLHYAETSRFYVSADVQRKWERAFAPFNAATMTSADEARSPQKAAVDLAFGNSLDRIARIAVDKDHPVLMPRCKVQK